MSDLRIDISDLGVQGTGTSSGVRRAGPDGNGKEDRRRGRWGRRLRWAALLAIPAAVVPFVLLLQGSLHAHTRWGLGPWGSVMVGMAWAVMATGVAVWLLSWLLRIPGGFRRLLARGGMTLAVVFVAYGLVYVGARNVKGDAVRAEYRALHPLLRLASTTLVLVDRNAVVTDARRAPEDYVAMGLTPLDASLHYPQPDGYVHALDLRTLGRGEWRNRLVEWSFVGMGFRVVRHVGTADHLHVSLPPREDGG